MADQLLSTWSKSQVLKAPTMKNAPPFYRNLEEALDTKRKNHGLLTIKPCLWKDGHNAIDFTSNDTLSLGTSGILRAEFDEEMKRNPDLMPGSTSSRIVDGNSAYLELVEREIADFHGAKEALFVASGFEANLAVFAALPRPGDVLVYDELVHASMYDGMERSPATIRRPFRHNDVEALRDILEEIHDAYEAVRRGKSCVIVAVESVYSMDGDICPLEEMVEVAREIFPENVEFVVDEAHSTGVIGPNGAGLVSELGLERDIAVRVHTFGKAVSAAGAVILGNETVKTALANLARSVIYTTAPANPVVASVRAAYNLMKSGRTQEAQERIQHLVAHFFTSTSSNTTWKEAISRGIISVPLAEDWSDRPIQTHIIPIWTRNQYALYLASHLLFSGFTAFFAEYPTVPKGQSRVRLAFHSCNTEDQIEKLIASICEWAEEMMAIEDGTSGDKLPKAAKRVFEFEHDTQE